MGAFCIHPLRKERKPGERKKELGSFLEKKDRIPLGRKKCDGKQKGQPGERKRGKGTQTVLLRKQKGKKELFC